MVVIVPVWWQFLWLTKAFFEVLKHSSDDFRGIRCCMFLLDGTQLYDLCYFIRAQNLVQLGT
jgi:hypothetical protein